MNEQTKEKVVEHLNVDVTDMNEASKYSVQAYMNDSLGLWSYIQKMHRQNIEWVFKQDT